MKSRKSQIKMFESIAILVVFFILIMFGFMFYTSIQKGEFQEEQQEAIVLNAIKISEQISFLPELQCSRDNIPEEDCIDLLKLSAASGVISSNRETYFEMLGYSDISVEEVYPTADSWQLYDYPKEDYIDKLATQFPISLYDPTTDSYYYGVLYVNIYN